MPKYKKHSPNISALHGVIIVEINDLYMADTSHTPIMKTFDSVTVILYRSGIVIIALLLTSYILEYLLGKHLVGNLYIPLLVTGTALSSANIHLYDHRFRYLIPLMSWIGLVLLSYTAYLSLATGFIETVSLGFLYAGIGMFALKEDFCFKIPGLKTVPLFLAASVFLRFLGFEALETYALLPAALLMLVLSIAKWRMPLHFDVGDKSKYTH